MEASLPRDPRRAEMADLLRARRRAMSVEGTALPLRSRRRTPGLRREEVAELAGISTALYTWLEQGRDVPVSLRTLDAVATALRLTDGERALLHRLIAREPAELREEITAALRCFVDALRGPAFVIDRRWDVVRRNTAAAAIFGGSDDLDERSNLLINVFLDAGVAGLFVDYERVTASIIAMFRLDYASHIDDPRAQETVDVLHASVPGFDALWQEHRVREYPEGIREIVHPIAGVLRLSPALFGVLESPGLRVFAFTAADAATQARIDATVARRPGTSSA